MPSIYDAVHAYTAAINSMSADNFTACFAPGGELADPVTAPALVAPDGTTAFFNQFLPIAENVYFRAGKIFAAGNHASFTWTMEATGKNGRVAVADGIDTVVLDDNGKILRLEGYWDAAAFIAALTAPKP